jgi:phosphoglycolate phosphatase-like HAD superfamily hydrolase
MAQTTAGVILDIDGTLIDSNDAHAHAWVEALAEFGFEVEYARVRPMIGMGGDKLLPKLTGLPDGTDTAKRIGERRAAIFRERYLPSLRAFPHTRDLLVRMRDEGMKLGVATSAKEEELDSLLRVAGADDLVESATSASEAGESKPDPDVVEAAIERLELDAGRLVMLGDTPYDVAAARRAGVRIVALRCGGWGDEALEGAVAVYDDPADLLAHYDESPFAE